jgi:hypothetical protein
MPNSSLTPKENIEEITGFLFEIITLLSKEPQRFRDKNAQKIIDKILTGPLHYLRKYFES